MAKGPNLYNDLPPLDSAKSAADMLNSELSNYAKKANEKKHVEDEDVEQTPEVKIEHTIPEQRVDVRNALRGGPILERVSTREHLRVLILTRDLTILKTGSLSQRRLLELARVFAEIHIIILSERGEGSKITVRLGSNVWIYPTYSTFWWQTGIDAYRIAKEQLTFAQGFRADLIITEDPFESGVAGYFIAEKYGRPLQIHVYEDFYDPVFKLAEEQNKYRKLMAKFSLRYADCIRTKTESLRDKIVEKYPDLKPFTDVLPMYHNLSAWRDFIPAFDLHARYPQFNFIILHISNMTALSHTDHVINGCLRILKQYQSIGLVIVGNGPFRSVYEKHVIAMGMQNQIVFEPMPTEVVSHMKSANILIHLSEDSDEEDLILQAAAAKLPMIAGALGIAGDLFLDGESAFICPNGNPACVGEKLNRFLNENQLHALFGLGAQEIVFDRIEQNFDAYLSAYQESIERCLTLGS